MKTIIIAILALLLLAACGNKPAPDPAKPSAACSADTDCASGQRCDTCPSTCPPGTEMCAAVCGPPVCVAATGPKTCGTDADCADGYRCNTCPPPDGCTPTPDTACPAVCGTPVCQLK